MRGRAFSMLFMLESAAWGQPAQPLPDVANAVDPTRPDAPVVDATALGAATQAVEDLKLQKAMADAKADEAEKQAKEAAADAAKAAAAALLAKGDAKAPAEREATAAREKAAEKRTVATTLKNAAKIAAFKLPRQRLRRTQGTEL
jgi:hypothetical protein